MAEMVDCTQCGADNPFDAHFCINCGASLKSATTGPTARLMGTVCPRCGTNNPEDARFCATCGQSFSIEPAPARPTPARPNVWHGQGGGTMYCPVCREVTLVMADRQGIEVDYCPQCRGVWLDRGELDKIIERVALAQGGATRQVSQVRDSRPPEYRENRDHDDDYHRKKKRRNLLDDIFDFD